jgi:hypothetical protein
MGREYSSALGPAARILRLRPGGGAPWGGAAAGATRGSAPRARGRRHILQVLSARVGASSSSDWFGAGTAAPNCSQSHLSLAWPLGLTVNG